MCLCWHLKLEPISISNVCQEQIMQCLSLECGLIMDNAKPNRIICIELINHWCTDSTNSKLIYSVIEASFNDLYFCMVSEKTTVFLISLF